MKKLILAIFVVAALVLGINGLVMAVGGSSLEKASDIPKGEADCILVLGAGVYTNGMPTPILKDRLDRAVELYRSGAARKLLLTGDNGTQEYDEVKVMKDYCLKEGVAAEDIFLDHAGFSTYESIYRARDVFGVKSAVVVTQRYHEYRALYIAKRLGLSVRGVAADEKGYSGKGYREMREVFARDKDFFKCLYQPKPTYLGEPIAMDGDGRVTW